MLASHALHPAFLLSLFTGCAPAADPFKGPFRGPMKGEYVEKYKKYGKTGNLRERIHKNAAWCEIQVFWAIYGWLNFKKSAILPSNFIKGKSRFWGIPISKNRPQNRKHFYILYKVLDSWINSLSYKLYLILGRYPLHWQTKDGQTDGHASVNS